MIRHAKQLIADGLIGELRVVQAEYPQGWLATALEKTGQKQASWRTDPKLAGAGALGDIGSHSFQLAEFVTGAKVSEVAADVSAIVPGRRSTTTSTCCCVSPTARAVVCGPARWRSAT
jgi:predicted dehydrogenase